MMTHSRRLCSRIELALPAVADISNEIISHPRFKAIYPELLIRMYWLIRFSVPVMEAAIAECERRADHDQVAAALLPYLREHIEEERDHDEYLLQDLELLNYPRQMVLRRLPPPSIAASEGAMYYWTVLHHPVAILGGMIPSECYPMSLETIDWMEQTTGYPRAAFRTIEMHSDLDQGHGAEALAMLDSLPLDDWHHEVLGVSALHFLAGTTKMYREFLDEFPA